MSIWKIILGILGYLLLFSLIGISNGGISFLPMYTDAMTILYLLAFTPLTLWCTGTLKDFVNGIKITLGIKKTYSLMELKRAGESMNLTIASQPIFGGIYCAMSLIAMLYHMDSPQTMGPSLAVVLLSILYALLIALAILPFKIRVHMLLISYAEEDATKTEEVSEELLEQRVFYLFRSKGLTDREAEIARLISQEMTNREIAGKLYISEATVKKHITHILEKLDLEGREAIIECITKEIK